MKVREYKHLYVQKREGRGYRWEIAHTPEYLTLTITEDKNSKFLTVKSRIHVNKSVIMHPAYGLGFTDQQIIKDLSGEIYKRFIN